MLDIKKTDNVTESRAFQRDGSLEAQLQATFNLIPAHVWYADSSGALIFVSERIADYLGLPKDHPLRFGIDTGAEWDSHVLFLHPDDREEARRVWSTCLRTGSAGEASFRVRNAAGDYRWFLSRAEPLRASDGTLLFWIGVNLEADEAKRVEEDLRRTKHYLMEAERLSHTGSWAYDAAGFQYWSSELFRIYGLDAGSKAPTTNEYLGLVHPDDRQFMEQAIHQIMADHYPFDFTKRIVRPDGSIRYIRCVGHPSMEGGTFRGVVGSAVDVTEQELLTQELRRREIYLAENNEALRTSEAYLAEAQTLSHMGSWAWEVAGREALHLSDEWYRIYGFDPKQGRPSWEERLQRVHPEDKDKWRGAIETAIREKSNYDVEFRILLPDGTLKWVHTVGHPVISAAGELEQFVGSSMDVTARKQADEQLKAQDMELRQVLDLAPQLVAVFGPRRERLYANRMVLDYLGISLEEWRQESVAAEVHPDDRQRLKTYFDRARLSGSAYEVEMRLRKSDGTYRWFLARYNPLHDEKGQLTRWYVAGTDIDDRKKVEERLQEENAALREEIDKASMFEEIVGTSPALKAVLSHISKVAPSDSTVLITGETGTGKELVARAIHRRSARASRPFVSVNCAAIPRDLIASELFGHEKGAFTGATQRRVGRFELADGGTIFLDEIGELLPDTQVALLRVLQEREFERVGGSQPIHVNVRIIAATNRELEEAVASGTFRADLFYRLNVFPLDVPSLRERKDDILMLVEYFVQRYARKGGKRIRSIDKKTLDLLQSYEWPGNIRELQNVIERSVILSSGEVLSVDEWWLSREATGPSPRTESQPTARSAVEPRSEREIIEAALLKTRGRVSGASGAAARLGVPPSTLEHRIRTLKIDKRRFKFV